MILNEILGAVTIMLSVIGYIPYLRDTFKGRTKPHAFSWLIWGILTAIAFFGQLSDGGGPGTWATGLTTAACFTIFIAGLRCGERNITMSDWVWLVLALAAIPLWLITDSPLWSVILVTGIDVIAFFPTLRKSYLLPNEETLSIYLIGAVKFALAIFALENLSTVTVLYPFAQVVMDLGVVAVLLSKRRSNKSEEDN